MLLLEAEIFGLAPLSEAVYSARDNELGLVFELLLYGTPGHYGTVSARMRTATLLMMRRNEAAKYVGRMLRGWIARAQVRAYKAAVVVQAIYRRWKRVSAQRGQQRRPSMGAGGAGGASPGGARPSPPSPKAIWGRASKILARKRGGGGGGGGGGAMGMGAMLKSLVADASEQAKGAESDVARLAKQTAPMNKALGGANEKSALGVALPRWDSSRHAAADSSMDVSEEDARIAEAASRIQARMRGLTAQKEVLRLAEAAEAIVDDLRNPIGADAVSAVCKAYRAKAAFSMLLLKAFKQRNMAIVLRSTDDAGSVKAGGCAESTWRMAVETVRLRRRVASRVPTAHSPCAHP